MPSDRKRHSKSRRRKKRLLLSPKRPPTTEATTHVTSDFASMLTRSNLSVSKGISTSVLGQSVCNSLLQSFRHTDLSLSQISEPSHYSSERSKHVTAPEHVETDNALSLSDLSTPVAGSFPSEPTARGSELTLRIDRVSKTVRSSIGIAHDQYRSQELDIDALRRMRLGVDIYPASSQTAKAPEKTRVPKPSPKILTRTLG